MARQAPRGRSNGPAHHDSYDGRSQGGGGIPDGLLIGLLALLLAAILVTWTATGLAGLLAHGAWPDGVTFFRSPLALRELATAPQDLPAAWPETPPAQLSGYGLFWGLFIGELMVLLVMTVFTLGVVSRGRAVRERRREDRALKAHEPPLPTDRPAQEQAQPEAQAPQTPPAPPAQAQPQPQPQAPPQPHPTTPPSAEKTPPPPETNTALPLETSTALLPSPRTPL
ncbi:type VI secretion protein, partial [Streptomyces sp. Ju416(a)]